jgi:DNA adenine methylase
VPHLKDWVAGLEHPVNTFVEPFAGGAMCGLSVASGKLAGLTVLGELDDEVAAVWSTIFHGSDADFKWLSQRILNFVVTEENVREEIATASLETKRRAFRTIIKNRMQRAGIIADGAGLLKAGERGRGLLSRWYPETLVDRMNRIREFRSGVQFLHCDAFDLIAVHSRDKNAAFLIDPPYTAGGKNAGSRLYNHHQLDHDKLFKVMAAVAGSVMMTYDDSDEVKGLAAKYGFEVEYIPMRSSHHKAHSELMITKPRTIGHKSSQNKPDQQ